MRVLTFELLALTALAVSGASSAAPAAPPKEALRAFNKAEAAVKAKRTDEALRDYQQAVSLFPGYAEAWYGLGKLRVQLHDPAAARRALESAVRADPKYVDPYLTLAALESASGNWKEVVRVTDLLLALNEIDYPQAWLLNAVGNDSIGNLAAAEQSARQAEQLDIQRKFPDSLRVLGAILAKSNDFAGAAAQFREYLRVAPSGPKADEVRRMMAEAEKRTVTSAPGEPGPTFIVDTNLAVVRFQVHEKKGQPIRDLTPQDIQIREDGMPQKIAVFEGLPVYPRSLPIEISLLFDCSASVERIGAINPHVLRQNLLDEFPNASVAIYGFSDYLARFTRPSRDPNSLKIATDHVSAIPAHNTPLFGSVADTVRDANMTRGSVLRMLVIFSDGLSNWPGDESHIDEVTRAAQDSGTALYPVLLTGGSTMPSASETGSKPAIPPGCLLQEMQREQKKREQKSNTSGNTSKNGNGGTTSKSGSTRAKETTTPRNQPKCPESYRKVLAARRAHGSADLAKVNEFMNLADATGGKGFQRIMGTDVLPSILKGLAEEIRYDYVAGFYLPESTEKKKHKVEVVLRSKDRGELFGGSRIVEY
jgi:VWFA-related protein